MNRWIVLLLCLVATVAGGTELSFAPVFNNGAVLQCEMPVNVWGSAGPGETVTVSFAGQKKEAVADADGRWKVQLDPMPPSSEPRTLAAVSSIGNQKSEIANVVVGEVWLATGQSNMVVPLRNTTGGEQRLKMTIPEIRFVKVPQQAGLPPRPFSAEQLAWKTFEPGPNSGIAAVAFYFAEQLQKEVGRTVGIIQSSYGGTPCQAWTPMRALDEKPELKYYAEAVRKAVAAGKSREEWMAEVSASEKWQTAMKKWNQTKEGPRPVNPGEGDPGNPWSQKSPTVLYENMITPLVPYTARGIIWYQGEANASKPDEYRVLFPAMINAWREVWQRPGMPFLFVQLAAYGHPTQDWSGLRAAQAFTRDTVPQTGMALAIDCGEEKNIHPAAKQPVGERLARLALNQVYGRNTACRGPLFQTLEKNGTSLRIVFQYSENGLKTSDGKQEVSGFEVAGADGKFYLAQARIASKDTVELTCAQVPQPEAVRYAWASWIEPPVTLQNGAGLPIEPFYQKVFNN